jgi:endonuclease/exonuclease/phosphatase family metal-dependent hydrolase
MMKHAEIAFATNTRMREPVATASRPLHEPPVTVRPMLTVMTRNLFLGADLTPAYDALADPGGLAGLPAVVAGIFNPSAPLGAVQRTDFATRVVALADEIEATHPDLIGLQEAAVWRTRPLSPGAGAEGVIHDHLGMLEAELARRELGYRRVATVEIGDVELPSAAGIGVGLTNRDAILAREQPPGGDVGLSNVRTGAFVNLLALPTAQGTFALARGWAAVDAQLRGRTIRFIATHLEVASSPAAADVQLLQARELVDGPARTSLPVVMLGDFNARPGTATYDSLRAAGFDDAWTRANDAGLPGPTCCHAPSLADPADVLRRRIDLILTRGDIAATECHVVGDRPGDFRAGLWPSDHAGVVARLEFTGT